MKNTITLSDYSIHVGNEIWDTFNQAIEKADYSKIAVLVDENTAKYCLPIFKEKTTFEYETIQIAAGEIHKNIETCQQIWQAMMRLEMNRNAVLINLGGGVIGDMGGFCASTFKRGMAFVQLPTTLLAQVDASVGGKLGIDFEEVKNSIGVFNNPKGVFIYPDFLKTLSEREVRSGFAEIIKHSLIASSTEWQKIISISDLRHTNWDNLLLPSLYIKRDIVTKDPFERGIRKALNFGHTIGHAVESYFLKTNKPLLHGEAVAIGMVCESYLSYQKTGLKKSELDLITTFIIQRYGKPSIPETAFEELLAIMQQDKKNESQAINFTLLHSIGDAIVNQTANRAEIKAALGFYNEI